MKNFRGPFSPTQGTGNPKFLEHSHAKKNAKPIVTEYDTLAHQGQSVNMCQHVHHPHLKPEIFLYM